MGGGWTIDAAGIVHRGRPLAGDIVTRDAFHDFELTFEWKISQGGNSGIKYRTRGSLGLEYQILDDDKHKDGKKPSHRAGGLYDLVAPSDDKPIEPVGQWNSGRIVARGNRIEHWLNGSRVVDIEIGSDEWTRVFSLSKYKKHEGFGTWTGPVLLQDHNDKVWFRNLKIRSLDAEQGS